MSEHRWTGTLDEAVALVLFRASGWLVGDRATIALAFVCDAARDRALTATGPARHDALPGLRDALFLLEQRRDKLREAAARGQENRVERVEAMAAVDLIKDQIERVAATGPGSGAADMELARVAGRAAKNAPDFFEGEVEARYMERVGGFILAAIERYKTKGDKWPLKPRAPQTDHRAATAKCWCGVSPEEHISFRAAPACPLDVDECHRENGIPCAAHAAPATPPSGSPPVEKRFTLKLSCCGREDEAPAGPMTWQEADAFRESYMSGPGVTCPERPHEGGHVRSATIVEASGSPPGAAEACGPGCGTVVGRQKTPMYCSEACCDAGRSLNPRSPPESPDGSRGTR